MPPRVLSVPTAEAEALLPDRFQKWFAARGWSPRAHQLAMLRKARAGRSALLIAPTGAGKTLAGFLPTLVDYLFFPLPLRESAGKKGGGGGGGGKGRATNCHLHRARPAAQGAASTRSTSRR